MASYLELKNGQKMPIVGLGTWNSAKGEVAEAVKLAIDAGYRHIDCAHIYGNEHEVGEGIAKKIAEGVVKREDLFVTSKLWNNCHRPDLVRPALDNTLKNLGLDYINLYLVHWPVAFKEEGETFPVDKDGKVQFSDVDYVDTWKEMEKLVDAGLTKSIGISNFNKEQVTRVVDNARIKPVINQVESHPFLTQQKLLEFCRSKGIELTAYSPLGSPGRPWKDKNEVSLLENPKIKEIAERHKKTTAQVLIRYQVERGISVIPKSVNKSRIEANFAVFDFTLSKDEMDTLNNIGSQFRYVSFDDIKPHKYYPFDAEY